MLPVRNLTTRCVVHSQNLNTLRLSDAPVMDRHSRANTVINHFGHTIATYHVERCHVGTSPRGRRPTHSACHHRSTRSPGAIRDISGRCVEHAASVTRVANGSGHRKRIVMSRTADSVPFDQRSSRFDISDRVPPFTHIHAVADARTRIQRDHAENAVKRIRSSASFRPTGHRIPGKERHHAPDNRSSRRRRPGRRGGRARRRAGARHCRKGLRPGA